MPGVLSPVLEPAWDTQGPGSGARAPRRVDRYFPMLSWHRPSPFGLSRWDGSFEGTPSGNCLLTTPRRTLHFWPSRGAGGLSRRLRGMRLSSPHMVDCILLSSFARASTPWAWW